MLEELYKKYDVPKEDRIPLEKNILLLVPSPDYDISEAVKGLGLSRFEVAVTWPKESIDMLAEVCAMKPKFVLQCGCNLTRKFPAAEMDGEFEVFRDKALEATADSFVGLHHHDEFSIRDGLGTVSSLVELLKKQRRSFCCVSNHGTVGGWVRQYNACREAGIKAIFSMEAYYSPYRGDDPEEKKKHRKANHLLLIARTREGFDNIIRIHNDAQLNGFYYSPRVDDAAIEKWGKGIVATSSCFPSGTLVFTPDGFSRIEEKSAVVTSEGEYCDSVVTKRLYSGKMKDIVCRGIACRESSTADHEYLIVRKENQLKQNSSILPMDDKYRSVDVQVRRARRRNFTAEWTSDVSVGDWLLFPVESQLSLVEEIDTEMFCTRTYAHRVVIRDDGLKRMRHARKNGQFSISQLQEMGSWSKSSLLRIENGMQFPSVSRLKTHLSNVGLPEEFIDRYCVPASAGECGIKDKRPIPAKIRVTNKLLFLMGAYCAEGGQNGQSVTFTLHINEDLFAGEIANCMDEVFGLSSSHFEDKENNKRTVIISSVSLCSFFDFFCGSGCEYKRVPNFVFSLPFELSAYFLRGYMKGDGHLSDGGKRDGGHIVSVSVSQEMSLGVCRLFLRGGYYPTTNKRAGYTGDDGTKHLPHWSVHLSGRQSGEVAKWIWGDELPVEMPVCIKTRNHIPIRVGGTDYYTSLVKGVSTYNVRNTPVFCRTVDGHPSFVTGFASVHNCMKGEIPQLLMTDREDDALQRYEFYAKCFDRFYIEVQIIECEEQREVNRRLIRFARKVGAPLVIGCDSHYLEIEHGDTHNILMCIRQGKTVMEQKEQDDIWEFDVGNLYYRNEEQVRRGFCKPFREKDAEEESAPFRDDVFTDEVFEEALKNTRLISVEAEQIELDSTIRLPRLYSDGESILRKKVNAGFKSRGLGGGTEYLDQNGDKVKIPAQAYVDRLRLEFDVITKLGWTDYFLITERIISDARDEYGEWVVGYGRGSGAGSVVCYCLGITDVDPLVHGLLFERFLSEDRPDPPDIDNDFDPRYREAIKRHIVELFGEERVCSIGSYQTYRTSSVIADVARTLGLDLYEAREVTKKIQPLQAFEDEEGQEHKVDDMSFDDLFEHYPDLKDYFDKHPEVRRHAEILRNQVKNMGTHAGGVIISNLNLQGRIPVLYDKPGKEDRKVISAWAEAPGKNEDLSAVGLVKFDILGLKNLSVVADCVKLVEQTRKKHIARAEAPIDNREAIRICSRDDLVGIFQLENPATLPVAKEVGLETLGDVSALTSLIRPGPRDMGMDMEYARRKQGQPYDMPEFLKHLLADTYGVITFQEQCCPYGVGVLTKNGYVRIGDIVENGECDSVLCLNNSGDIVERRIEGRHSNGVKEVLRLTMDNGFVLECTEDHPVLTRNRGWVEAQYLTPEDEIVTTEDMDT